MFHYNSRSLISIRKDNSPREYFADAFATHFLVPTKELNRLIDNWGWKNRIDAHKAIELAYVFRVSYVFALYRLRNERHITEDQRQEWSMLSPAALAQQLGLDASVFHKPRSQGLNLNRYPASVLQTVRDLIHQDELYVSQAADLLDVSQAQVQSFLLSEPATATESERQELCEFAF
jgi:Zn-dependent peptidase ImmA (M78 family)